MYRISRITATKIFLLTLISVYLVGWSSNASSGTEEVGGARDSSRNSISKETTSDTRPTPPNDAVFMKDWVHRERHSFEYFVPNEQWLSTETTNGIDISSPTGDELVSFGYGPGSQNTLQQIESAVLQIAGVTGVNIVDQPAPVNSGSYVAQTIEFTGVSKTNNDIHGMVTAQVSSSWFGAYLIMAPTALWQKDVHTLQIIRDHITFLGRKAN